MTEHDKLAAVAEEHEVVQDFIDFVRDHDVYSFSKPEDHKASSYYGLLHRSLLDNDYQKLVAEFFNINYEAYQDEKEMAYDELRRSNVQTYA